MTNNILYTGKIDNYSSDNRWLRFKSSKNILVSDNGESMQCTTDDIPSSLQLEYDKNTENKSRTAVVTITQISTGRYSAITFTQKANLAGTFKDGNEYFSISELSISGKNGRGFVVSPTSVTANSEATMTSAIIISQKEGGSLSYDITCFGNVITLSAAYHSVKSQKYVVKDEYGNITSSYTETVSEENKNITDDCSWYVIDSSNNSIITVDWATLNKNILTINSNDTFSTRSCRIMAVYNDVSGYTQPFIQASKLQKNTYTVKTNNPNTIVHVISLNPKGEIISGTAEQKDNAYIFTYEDIRDNLYAYVEKESGFTEPKIVVKDWDNNIKEKFIVESGGTEEYITCEGRTKITTYKSSATTENPTKLKYDSVVEIDTKIDKTFDVIISGTSASTSVNWINYKKLPNSTTYDLTIEKNESGESRKGKIIFSLLDNPYGINIKDIEIDQNS